MDRLALKSDASIRTIAPASKPKYAVSKQGYIKVRLSYLTANPQHLRSLLLFHTCGIQAPYNEEVSILLPRMKVFSLLETFIPSFEYLQQSGVIPKDAELQDFTILDEDNLTLSYIF